MKREIIVASKRAKTIPEELQKDNTLVRRESEVSALQKHIQSRAGTWGGKLSGKELLKRTRP